MSHTSRPVISSTLRAHKAPTATIAASRNWRRVERGRRRSRRRCNAVNAGASLRGTPQMPSKASMKRLTPRDENGKGSAWAR
eukprot:3156344-Rhodomonas_salina.1